MNQEGLKHTGHNGIRELHTPEEPRTAHRRRHPRGGWGQRKRKQRPFVWLEVPGCEGGIVVSSADVKVMGVREARQRGLTRNWVLTLGRRKESAMERIEI